MADVTVRTRKFMTNRLLARRQMVVDVIHRDSANVSRAKLREIISQQYDVKDSNTVILYGFRTAFGGGRSSGFALIYDNIQATRRFEPKYRLVRHGLAEAVTGSRKLRKERKNRAKKVRGSAKAKIGA